MKLTYEQLDSNMSLDPYSIVKLNYPPLYTKIVAFSSTIDLTQDETKIRSNIEKFIMEKAAKLILNLAGRTMSCVWCNDTAKQRDEAIREREEVRAMMVTLCHRVVNAAISEPAQETPMPPHEFREATQQDVERLMNNPIIQDMKWKSADGEDVK